MCGFKTYETAWCPGCGNFSILKGLKRTLEELGKKPHEVVISSGIGQAAKIPQYINVNGFNGLHGRAVPVGAAIKITNKNLTVIVESGEGDTYGEGGNHFIHNIRRNIDIAHFVHNNQIYGLTKGQASPTTGTGQITGVQTMGVINNPFNPLTVALSLGATFVARTFSGDEEHMVEMMKAAILHKGYALVDILQPCVTFNKVNTFKWYKDRVVRIDETHDKTDYFEAYKLAHRWGDDGIPIGIFYKKEEKTYHEKIQHLDTGLPLVDREIDPTIVEKYLAEFI
ncbi:2-oxoacid:ferredoxin oxidoreductase subunit beta [Anaerobranca gottschalkii]|uniref:2-oxoglutarate ferredoxin oxidoreductase subunit beta n=1 Tax=Anaerobranca gottschalkii DSM 13577 TaxID=1120990 RepID=A0A1I0CP05_9FIRM|nr:2-oxoacid:ferredoxin oxidoreductase subunit beta [Anaerobranca gottschalkii]SET21388.1 2-oxoglutarate ferredoxin oxidoreductase subunit beta [Anaerobranca gottschalkii DSM 13577]